LLTPVFEFDAGVPGSAYRDDAPGRGLDPRLGEINVHIWLRIRIGSTMN
jgi:hypothetical protein